MEGVAGAIATNDTPTAEEFRRGSRVRVNDIPGKVRAVDQYGRLHVRLTGAANDVKLMPCHVEDDE